MKDWRINLRALTTAGTMTLSEDGERIPFACGDEMIETGSDLIVTLSQDKTLMSIIGNPASRKVNLGDAKFTENLIS